MTATAVSLSCRGGVLRRVGSYRFRSVRQTPSMALSTTRSASPSPSRTRPPSAALTSTVVGAVAGALVFGLCYRVLTDDAYIAADYARQLGLHGMWGMVDGLPSNTATSPLSVLLLGGLTAIVRDALLAIGVLLVACLAVAGWWLHGIAFELGLPQRLFPILTVAVLAVNPLLMSSVGLESQLAVTLLIGASWAVVARKPAWLGVIAGLLVLARPDLGPAAIVCIACASSGRWRAVGAAAAVATPWFAFSWLAFGSAVPDTVIIKGRESWGGVSFWNSLPHYFGIFPAPIALSVILAAVGIVALFWWRRDRVAWVWAGAATAHYATLAVMHPGPFFWHTTFWLSGFALLGCAAVARASQSRGLALRAGSVVAASIFVVVSAISSANGGLPRPTFAPISFNWASPAQYRSLAEQLPPGSTVQSPGEIGTLAYYCHCRVVDQFADRGQFAPLLAKRLTASGPIERRVLVANYALFDPPVPARLDYRMNAKLVPPGEPAQMTSLFTRYGRQVTVTPVQRP